VFAKNLTVLSSGLYAKAMKILILHNSHRSVFPSGANIVVDQEARLLAMNGHSILTMNPVSDEFTRAGYWKKLSLVLQVPFSLKSYRAVRGLIDREKPDIVHVHNIFPILSPSVYMAAESRKVPIVQTLHDFRFFCPAIFFLRNGALCDKCKDQKFGRSVRYGCYMNSKVRTIPVALMLKLHHTLKTFERRIDTFIYHTESQKALFVDAGLEGSKLFLKPNFVEDTFRRDHHTRGKYVLFLGRIGEEKGLKALVETWRLLPDIPLKIIGDGPGMVEFQAFAKDLRASGMEFLGRRPFEECMEALDGARFLVMPSIWRETFGRVIVEAFCHAKPVIASNLGSMADLVRDGSTGLLFPPGEPGELAHKVRWLWDHEDACEKMGWEGRREYEGRYTPERNYGMLMEIYERTLESRRGVLRERR
jgi:glycosyltransferase involved in cell wall biosynthesis